MKRSQIAVLVMCALCALLSEGCAFQGHAGFVVDPGGAVTRMIAPEKPVVSPTHHNFIYENGNTYPYPGNRRAVQFVLIPNAPSGNWQFRLKEWKHFGPMNVGWRGGPVTGRQVHPRFSIEPTGATGDGRIVIEYDYEQYPTGRLYSQHLTEKWEEKSIKWLEKRVKKNDKATWMKLRDIVRRAFEESTGRTLNHNFSIAKMVDETNATNGSQERIHASLLKAAVKTELIFTLNISFPLMRLSNR
ncbi:hypothetical protein ACFL0L_05325 [Patescibacteria group bacterium]